MLLRKIGGNVYEKTNQCMYVSSNDERDQYVFICSAWSRNQNRTGNRNRTGIRNAGRGSSRPVECRSNFDESKKI